MLEHERQHFKNILEAKRNSLSALERDTESEALLDLGPEQTGEVSHVRLHPADLGTEEFDHELMFTEAEREISEIQEIEAALARVEREDFGCCENCGEEIPFDRLEAKPEARYCLECAKEREIKE